MWTAIAGCAHLALAVVGSLAYPYLQNVLIAIGYGLILPAVGTIHFRNLRYRQSGAILGSLAANATVTVGLGGSLNVDLRPAALMVLGIWWWTLGKMWAETGALPRSFGIATAGVAALTFLAVPVVATNAPLLGLVPGFPDLALWEIWRVGLGSWLLALAIVLWRVPREA